MKSLIFLLICGFLGSGIYYLLNSQRGGSSSDELTLSKLPDKKLYKVGEKYIFDYDVSFEADLIKMSADDSEWEPTEGTYELPTEIQEQILNSVLERSVLYEYIRQETKANHCDSKRIENEGLIYDVRKEDWLAGRTCEKKLIQDYLNTKLALAEKQSESSLEAYYKNHLQDFIIEEQWRVDHLLLESSEIVRAVSIAIEKEDFQDVSARVSAREDGDAVSSELVWVGRKNVPKLFSFVLKMQQGEVRGPIESEYGYHFVRLAGYKPSGTISYEEAKPLVIEKLAELNTKKEYEKWLKIALKNVPVLKNSLSQL